MCWPLTHTASTLQPVLPARVGGRPPFSPMGKYNGLLEMASSLPVMNPPPQNSLSPWAVLSIREIRKRIVY